jgi:hypothetical protein
LKLKYDKLLSIFGFNFNLRRYNAVDKDGMVSFAGVDDDDVNVVGRCGLTL